MPSINNNKAQNFLFSFSFMILLSSCSSMNVTEERVYEGGIKTVEASVAEVSELDYETKAIFANATVFFEFDSYNLTSKSIRARPEYEGRELLYALNSRLWVSEIHLWRRPCPASH